MLELIFLIYASACSWKWSWRENCSNYRHKFYVGNRVEEATEMLERGLSEYPTESLLNSSYAIILASLGEQDQAVEKMNLAIKHESSLMHVHHLYHNLAGASALLGHHKEAVEWLVKASKTGLTCYPLFDGDPNLKSLKEKPGFEDFMTELKKKWEYYKTL